MKESPGVAPSVLVEIVTYNSLSTHGATVLQKCLSAVVQSAGFEIGRNLAVTVRDNASTDGTAAFLKDQLPAGASLALNAANLGFSGAQNQGVKEFLTGQWEYLLVLNPDLALQPEALQHLVAALRADPQAGSATPRLYRADANLQPLAAGILDAAGMCLNASLRHFDRGSGLVAGQLYTKPEYVFGGTGACLLLKREFVKDMVFDLGALEADLGAVYPVLLSGREERRQLFDEAFLAYREDADLAWRAAWRGWKCCYVPTAEAYHCRVVLPEKRVALAPELNLLGVKNRFLLQINNYTPGLGLRSFLAGFLGRNLVVLLAVALWERSSWPALRQVWLLRRRAWALRRLTQRRARVGAREVAGWFKQK